MKSKRLLLCGVAQALLPTPVLCHSREQVSRPVATRQARVPNVT